MKRNPLTFWIECWSQEGDDGTSVTLLPQIVRLVTTLAIFMVADKTLHVASILPNSSYENAALFVEFWGRLFESWNLVLLVPVIAFAIWFAFRCPRHWNELSGGFYFKVVTMVSVGILVWRFVTLEHNYYFDQSYYPDRLLILVFGILIYFRPVFVLPFLLTLLPFVNQMNTFPGYALSIPSMPIHLTVLALSVLVIYSLSRKAKTNEFFLLSICIVGAHYWYPGFGKLRPNWVLYDNIPFVLFANYSSGWLGFLKPETVSTVYALLEYLNWPMKIMTLLLEVGSILAVWRKDLLKVFLCGWIALHLGIFALSGFFFWVWILIDLSLLVLLFVNKSDSEFSVFSLRRAVLGSILIVTGAFWTHPTKLAWFDMPATYVYEFEAETETGKHVELLPEYFEPFEYQFALGQFNYLSDIPNLEIVLGAGSYSVESVEMLDLADKSEFLNFEKRHGKIRADTQSATRFDQFLKRFVANRNSPKGKLLPLESFGPPTYFFRYPQKEMAMREDKIKAITIYQVTAFYAQGDYKKIRKRKVHEVAISQ